VGDFRREDAVESEPDEAFDELVDGEECGSVAKRSSRRCFTRESVAMPMPARTVLPAKLATAEKHIGRRFPGAEST